MTVRSVTAESLENPLPVELLPRCCTHPTPFLPPVLWNVYGDCDNFATLKGHSGAIMELHYNTDGRCGLQDGLQLRARLGLQEGALGAPQASLPLLRPHMAALGLRLSQITSTACPGLRKRIWSRP